MTSWSSHVRTTSAGLTAAVVLALAAVGGTYALWYTQVDLPGAMITSGNAHLAIESPSGRNLTPLYPGQTVSTPFDVNNTGTVPLALQIDSLTGSEDHTHPDQQDLTRSLKASVWENTGSGCATVPVDLGWSGPVESFSKELSIVVEPGATQSMCLAATLDAKAPVNIQGASMDLELTLGGVQQR